MLDYDLKGSQKHKLEAQMDCGRLDERSTVLKINVELFGKTGEEIKISTIKKNF